MGLYKAETKKMEFNNYNYKAEWIISNFNSFIGNKYNSPIFSCDEFQVQLSTEDGLSKDSNGLSVIFNFVSIEKTGLSLNYILQIENTDEKKTEKITGDELLNDTHKEFRIFTKTASKDLNESNGFLKPDHSLHITCFFKSNSTIDESSFGENLFNEIVVCEVNWEIKEKMSEFHSTEEPIQLTIVDKPISIAMTYELTEYDNYTFSIFLIDPTISFKGDLEVTIENQKDASKSIRKTKSIIFNTIHYEIEPITFSELNREDYLNPDNGWVIYGKDGEIESGLKINVKFKTLQKNALNKESVLMLLAQMNIYNEKKLRSEMPISIESISANQYLYNIEFPDVLTKGINEPISTPEYHTGGVCVKYVLDLPSKSFTYTLTDFPERGGFFTPLFTIENKDNSKNRSLPKKMQLFCNKQSSFNLEIPISVQDITDESKGWLFDGSLRVIVSYEEKSGNSFYLPVKADQSGNDNYALRYLIPLSLFDKDIQEKIINFPPMLVKQLRFTPFAYFSYNEDGKLVIKTQMEISKYDKESTIDIILTYENKDKDKNVISTFRDVDQLEFNMQEFVPENSLEDDGFVFFADDSTKVLHFTVRVHYAENSLISLASKVDVHPTFSQQTFEQREIQEATKQPTMLPEIAVNEDLLEAKVEKDKPVIEDSSKRQTGYVGLNNQGATCYMNSLLQSLYHLPAFRRLVYEMPTTGTEDVDTSIPLNLQRLFCRMQFDTKSCSTVSLTKSFGWGSAETFQQHDIEEFLRVLLDNLENKMKNSPLEKAIPNLFRGTYRNYIKCKNVQFENSKLENFYDLSMDVKGISNLKDSFKSYIKQEELTGDNQYSTDQYGKQDAIMGTEFFELPPVLHLHLRRFMYDYNLPNGMYKINDFFEFPEEIDLTEFLAKDSPDREKSNVYDLYGVLVHQGGVFGGHYYAFLRTSTSKQWYKFNDSTVTKDTAEKAIYDNFGNAPIQPASAPENKIDENKNDNEKNSDDAEYENDDEDDKNEFDFGINEDIERINNEDEIFPPTSQMGINVYDGRNNEVNITGISQFNHRKGGVSRGFGPSWKKNRNKSKSNKHRTNKRPVNAREKSYSGYLLVYVRREEAENIFEPISDESVPSHLLDYMSDLMKYENEKIKMNIKGKKMIKVRFAHEDVLSTNSANRVFGFFPPKGNEIEFNDQPENSETPNGKSEKNEDENKEEIKEDPIVTKDDLYNKCFSESINKSISLAELYKQIATKLNLDPSRIRLWRCGQGDVPRRIIPNSEKGNLAGASEGKFQLGIYVQPLNEENETIDIGNKFMIYVKFFFSDDLLKKQRLETPESQQLLEKQLTAPLQYLFSTPVAREDKIETLIPLINQRLGLPSDTKLDVYQETLNKSVHELSSGTSFIKNQIGSGSILVFQVSKDSIEKIAANSFNPGFDFKFPPQSASEENDQLSQLKLFKLSDLNEENSPLKSIKNFIQGKEIITFQVFNYSNPRLPLFLIQLPAEMKISDAKKSIIHAAFENKNEEGNESDVDLSSVVLFKSKLNDIVKIDDNLLYGLDVLRFNFNKPQDEKEYHKIYYFITNINGNTDNFVKHTVQFSADAKSIDVEASVYGPKLINCSEIFKLLKTYCTKNIDQMSELTKEMFNDKNNFRWIVVEDGMIKRVLTSDKSVIPYTNGQLIRIEVIPKIQSNIDPDNLLRVFYAINQDIKGADIYGIPFLFEVNEGELFSETKNRLKSYMGLQDNDSLDSYKFYMVSENAKSIEKAEESRLERAKKLPENQSTTENASAANETATESENKATAETGNAANETATETENEATAETGNAANETETETENEATAETGNAATNETSNNSDEIKLGKYDLRNSHQGITLAFLDDFAMIYEFIIDGTFQLRMAIVPPSPESPSDNSKVDALIPQPPERPHHSEQSSPRHHPAKQHPSHNDVRIYN